MQDQYTCDVGDFGKYGLLRSICGTVEDSQPFRLGVVWYRVPNDGGNDGRHVTYLLPQREPRFINCDPELYRHMRQIYQDGLRRVAAIRERHVLGLGTQYYEVPLSFSEMSKDDRPDHREKWVSTALAAVKGCDIVFLDPDNGMECPSVGKYSRKGPKYTFYDEVERFWHESHTLYHHLCGTRQLSSRLRGE